MKLPAAERRGMKSKQIKIALLLGYSDLLVNFVMLISRKNDISFYQSRSTTS